MQLPFQKGAAPHAAPRNALARFSRGFAARLTAATAGAPPSPASRPSRLRKLLSYYRPHLPLLVADLGCAILVSATALFLPLCANYVTKQLVGLTAAPEALGQIYLMGAVMLAVLGIQVLSTFFVDYQGHMMGGAHRERRAPRAVRALPEALLQLLRPAARRPADEPHHQ